MIKYRIWLTLGLSIFAALTLPNGAAIAQRQARPSVSPLALELCQLPGWNEDVRAGNTKFMRIVRRKRGDGLA